MLRKSYEKTKKIDVSCHETQNMVITIPNLISKVRKELGQCITLISAGVNMKRRITAAGIETLESSRPPV